MDIVFELDSKLMPASTVPTPGTVVMASVDVASVVGVVVARQGDTQTTTRLLLRMVDGKAEAIRFEQGFHHDRSVQVYEGTTLKARAKRFATSDEIDNPSPGMMGFDSGGAFLLFSLPGRAEVISQALDLATWRFGDSHNNINRGSPVDSVMGNFPRRSVRAGVGHLRALVQRAMRDRLDRRDARRQLSSANPPER